jgi:hypothetical protein
MFLIYAIRNRERASTCICPLGAVRVAVICLMLMLLKPKSSRLLEISSAYYSNNVKVIS